MAFVASHYLAPIAAIQQRIRTKKATQLDSENFYIRSSAAHFGAAIYATRVPVLGSAALPGRCRRSDGGWRGITRSVTGGAVVP